VPFALRYPPLAGVARTEDQMVQVIDLAPTIYELAGLPIPNDVDGKSLVPLLRGEGTWRNALLLEGWPGAGTDLTEIASPIEKVSDLKLAGHYQAIRTANFVYVETDNDSSELYDLRVDPWQLRNVVKDAAYRKTVKQLKRTLKKGPF
jgi:arylsulfatase A-like enzyme